MSYFLSVYNILKITNRVSVFCSNHMMAVYDYISVDVMCVDVWMCGLIQYLPKIK